jgi:hypothetical protein
MKKILLQAIFFLIVTSLFGQKKAVTETGEEVTLYNDGTWKYANDSLSEKKALPTNPKTFKKNVGSAFLLKSSRIDVGVWLDAKKWNFKKASTNEAAEYELQLKGKDLYGMMITESIEIPIETLRGIAVKNAGSVAPDIKVIKEEYRTVNNKKILLIQMNGTMRGIKFTYYGYYYSNAKGTVQLVTYTAQNLFASYLSDMEDLLNGFVTVNN